jgi:hypothetical protein
MALITYRRLDANHDPVMGGGAADFVSDIDAVAQAIQTRLLLFLGEWWENQEVGLPLFQNILGQGASQSRLLHIVSQLIQQNIYGAPYVTDIPVVQIQFDPVTRTFQFYAVVLTTFGTITVSNYPVPLSSGGV